MMEERIRREMVDYSRRVHARGWVANHDGNLSFQLAPERVLCTPTAISKGDVSPEHLIVVNRGGERLEGTRKPFSEFRLHRAAYGARPDIRAVLHAHPPTATGFAVAGVDLGEPFMAEPVVSLGARIPTVPYAFPGDPEQDRGLAAALAECNAVLLAGHGALTVGPSLELCFLRMELLEHLCRIARVARELGGARPIPAEHVQKLLEKRRAAGMEPPRPAAGTGTGPTAPPDPPVTRPVSTPGRAEDIVAEALKRLGGGGD